MKITTYGHCCLLIETRGKRILTDPGVFSEGCTTITDIDIILITHEHADHLHTESLETIIEQNPSAQIISNESVGNILTEKGIHFSSMKHSDTQTLEGISLKAYEGEHVEIFDEYGIVQNTGFLIADELFYPGDAYTIPEEPVTALALPVAGPWCKLADAIRYAIAVTPKVAFPVHDAVLSEGGKKVTYPHCERELNAKGITFRTFDEDKSIEI